MTTPDHDADGVPPDANATGRAGRRRSWVPGTVFAVLFVTFAIPAYFTATPARCASCHEMEPYYESWQSSSHRAAASNCLYCHAKPGLLGFAMYELAFYREIVGHIAGAEVSSAGFEGPGTDSCQRDECHSLNREASNSGDLKINHRAHVVDEGLGCSGCHAGAVHEGVGGRLKVPPMETCKECHAEDMQTCEYCHAGKVLPDAPGTH